MEHKEGPGRRLIAHGLQKLNRSSTNYVYNNIQPPFFHNNLTYDAGNRPRRPLISPVHLSQRISADPRNESRRKNKKRTNRPTSFRRPAPAGSPLALDPSIPDHKPLRDTVNKKKTEQPTELAKSYNASAHSPCSSSSAASSSSSGSSSGGGGVGCLLGGGAGAPDEEDDGARRIGGAVNALFFAAKEEGAGGAGGADGVVPPGESWCPAGCPPMLRRDSKRLRAEETSWWWWEGW